MAIPKNLKPITEAKAKALIEKHLRNNTGWWEGAEYCSDFVYESGAKRVLLRPTFSEDWETGTVVM